METCKHETIKSLKIYNVFGFTRKIIDDSHGLFFVVVKMFDENINDFHVFLGECVLFP